MIIYNGTKNYNGIDFISFKNDSGKEIDIPLNKNIFTQFMMAFEKLKPTYPRASERNNDEYPVEP